MQKAGTAAPSGAYRAGMITTNTASSAYLIYDSARVTLFLRSFTVGIRCSPSWMRPMGHSQPQITRPRRRPNSSRIPIT